jgi:predicted alpha/beta hydrolase family esterase
MKGIIQCLFVLVLLFSIISAHEPNFTICNNAHNDCNTAYIFAHGLGATQQQGLSLFLRQKTSNQWIIDEPVALFDFPDAKNNNNEYFRKEVNLGQKNDIHRLSYAFDKAMQSLPQHDFILAGISRGSATIINYVSQSDHQEKIKALVLESPFDTLDSIIKHLLSRYCIGWLPFSQHLGTKVCQKHFPSVDPKGIFPLDVIQRIPSTIPILLAHSKKDKVIPINSSRRLYIKLREAGHQHIYLAELQSGAHGKLIQGADADFYLSIVHAFYKKYNLPHDQEYAARGHYLLEFCQPPIHEVLQRVRHKRSPDDEEEDDSDDDAAPSYPHEPILKRH